jgi:hypothetical protein
LVGKDARRMTRWSTAIVLVGAVSSVVAGVAVADVAGGVNVPDSTFRQGTGTQEIYISVGRPLVGTAEALVIWPMYHSNDQWLLGVIADPATGARCGYDAGQWQCVPGRSGWQAGDLQVSVSTVDAIGCGSASGVCDQDEVVVQSLPFMPNPRGGGPPGGPPLSVSGSVAIMSDQANRSGPTPTPSATVNGALVTSGDPAPRTSSAGAGEVATSSAPSASAVSTPSTSSGALLPSVVPSATSIAAEDTSSTTQQGSDLGIYAALLIPILLGVGAPFGYHALRRRGNGRDSAASGR